MHHTDGVPAAEILKTCEHLYQQHGFVKWADVGRALGISRQAVQLRLRALQSRGELEEATYERWSSMTARSAATRERQKAALEQKREAERHTIRLRLSPENAEWLRAVCKVRNVTSADLINGLITKEINR